MSLPVARNVGIIVLIALAVAFVPGGGESADLVAKTFNAIFIVLIALIVGTLYRRYRGEIFGLGDPYRFSLYASVGIAILTVSVTGQLWATGAGALVWFVLIGGTSYTLYAIWQRYRSYS